MNMEYGILLKNILICKNCKLQFTSNKRKQDYCKICYKSLYDKNLIKAKPAPPSELSELQKEVLIGSLLGDAHLSRPKKDTHNSYLIIARQILNKQYLEWQYNIFKNFCILEPIIKKSSLNKKINKQYDQIWFHTRAANIFSEYRKLW